MSDTLPRPKFSLYSVVLDDIEWVLREHLLIGSEGIVWSCEVKALNELHAAQLAVHMLAEETGFEVATCQPSVVLIDG